MLSLSEALSVGFVSAATIFILFTGLAYTRQLLTLLDLGWVTALAGVAVSLLLVSDTITPTQYVVSVLVVIWALRLWLHLARRLLRQGEDWRYQELARDATYSAPIVLKTSLMELLMLLVVSLPIIFASTITAPFGPLQYVGVLIWAVGFYLEYTADAQLRRFLLQRDSKKGSKKKKQKERQFLTGGLWRFSRHPNYFGEFSQWLGLAVIVASADSGWLAYASPVLLLYILIFISGIRPLEQKYADNKEYRRYKKRTSAFLPLPHFN